MAGSLAESSPFSFFFARAKESLCRLKANAGQEQYALDGAECVESAVGERWSVYGLVGLDSEAI